MMNAVIPYCSRAISICILASTVLFMKWMILWLFVGCLLSRIAYSHLHC